MKKSIKVLQETKENGYFQRIVEYGGFKFKYSVTPNDTDPLVVVGGDWYHSLSIMLPDGTFKQIEDARSVGSGYSHHDVFDEKTLVARYRIVSQIYSAFDTYVLKVY